MSSPESVTVICRYIAKPGKEAELEGLLRMHWTTLHAQGLVTDRRPQIFRGCASPGSDDKTTRTYVELFEWKSPDAPGLAHQLPAILAIWEPMGSCCDAMEFPHFSALGLVDA